MVFQHLGFLLIRKNQIQATHSRSNTKSTDFFIAFPTFGVGDCHIQSLLATVCPRAEPVRYTLIARSRLKKVAHYSLAPCRPDGQFGCLDNPRFLGPGSHAGWLCPIDGSGTLPQARSAPIRTNSMS